MEPIAYATIADDFRVEATGKFMLIGIYPTDMLFESFPATVAQLVLFITLISGLDSPIPKFTVHVTCPGTNHSEEVNFGPVPQSGLPDATRLEGHVSIWLRPLTVTGPGVLAVKIEHPGGELIARRLRLRSVAEAEAEQNAAGTQPAT